MLYFAQATKAVDALARDNNDQRYNDVCKQVEVTKGLMLFGKNEVTVAFVLVVHEVSAIHELSLSPNLLHLLFYVSLCVQYSMRKRWQYFLK